MKTKFAALLAVAAIGASVPAMAQNEPPMGQHAGHHMGGKPGAERRGPPSPDKIFDLMDVNHDGKITKAEFTAAHEKMRAMRAQHRAEGGFKGRPMAPGQERPNAQ